jgi:hypothetical protein
MYKCPSIIVLAQTISDLLGHMLRASDLVTSLCLSNEHLVELSQKSDPNLFGSDKCYRLTMSEC